MRTKLIAGIVAAGLTISSDTTLAQDFSMEFERGVDGWRTVVDGVMGGLSTGRVSSPQSGVMRFSFATRSLSASVLVGIEDTMRLQAKGAIQLERTLTRCMSMAMARDKPTMPILAAM